MTNEEFTLDVRAVRKLWERIEIDPKTGCWLWKPGLEKNQYGYYQIGERKIRVHRLMYWMFVKSIERGMFICHRCDRPPCCNPAHLFEGSPVDNMQDAKKKGRLNEETQLKPGEHNIQAVLTADVVLLIRKMAEKGTGSRPIARELGLPRTTVQDVILRKTWTHV